jgi:hypothetical protein
MPRWQGFYTRSITSGTEGTPQLPTANWQLATSGLESKTNMEEAIPEFMLYNYSLS